MCQLPLIRNIMDSKYLHVVILCNVIFQFSVANHDSNNEYNSNKIQIKYKDQSNVKRQVLAFYSLTRIKGVQLLLFKAFCFSVGANIGN